MPIADYKRPAQIVMVERLPRNENGKVQADGVRDLVGRMIATRRGQQ